MAAVENRSGALNLYDSQNVRYRAITGSASALADAYEARAVRSAVVLPRGSESSPPAVAANSHRLWKAMDAAVQDPTQTKQEPGQPVQVAREYEFTFFNSMDVRHGWEALRTVSQELADHHQGAAHIMLEREGSYDRELLPRTARVLVTARTPAGDGYGRQTMNDTPQDKAPGRQGWAANEARVIQKRWDQLAEQAHHEYWAWAGQGTARRAWETVKNGFAKIAALSSGNPAHQESNPNAIGARMKNFISVSRAPAQEKPAPVPARTSQSEIDIVRREALHAARKYWEGDARTPQAKHGTLEVWNKRRPARYRPPPEPAVQYEME